jgi:ATP-dependent DNA helicase RecQ
MGYLIKALDGDPSLVTKPALPQLPTDVNQALVGEAITFLRRSSLSIEPRKIWPAGGMPRYGVKGAILSHHRPQFGKALCIWGDAGWGGMVRQGKLQDHRFADDLVGACTKMIREWNPHPKPTWVTCVPSLRHPELVPDVAKRLADALGLPFHMVIAKRNNTPEQRTMANSTQQARNLDGSLVPNVFLVDDMVDSRWTLTVATWLLRSSGSGDVFPVTLSLKGQDE